MDGLDEQGKALPSHRGWRQPGPSATSLPTHRWPQAEFIHLDPLLNPHTLTIGFARRFATYKRAPLIFQKFEAIAKLATDPERPIQFIFAGKAHPMDHEGKRYIQHIIHLSQYSELRNQMVRRAMATLVPRFTTWRMIQEYTPKYYLS